MDDSSAAAARAYHQRTKHSLRRYAAGPETLDWEAQPDPFRRYDGAALLSLPLVADELPARWADLYAPGHVAAQPVDLRAVAALFELSFGITAWKQFGPDRWAVRANPSSGNLHPTEAYLVAQGVAGLADGLHHYAPREHGLEQRLEQRAAGASALWVGLSSIQWREAWKYGERAFRYCQLDAGHALGALRYAAAVLGWQTRVVESIGHAELAALLGLDRDADFGRAEREEPELLVQVGPDLPAPARAPQAWSGACAWTGQANRLDAHPMYRWPVIDAVAAATRMPTAAGQGGGAAEDAMHVAAATETAATETTGTGTEGRSAGEAAASAPDAPRPPQPGPAVSASASGLVCASPLAAIVAQAPHADAPAATLIRQRRSAQRFDRRAAMPAAAFFRFAAALLPAAGLPWEVWGAPVRVHPLFYAHRVDGLAPGAYLLPRRLDALDSLVAAIAAGQPWEPVAGAPAGLPLLRVAENPALTGTLRTLSCHQAIASDACFAVSLIAEFEAALEASADGYRALLQEAGLVGQVLYLQAEAEGYRGTGIGCYFDDEVHTLLGLRDARLQVVYHFTVGLPVQDDRIVTEAPYAHRAQPA